MYAFMLAGGWYEHFKTQLVRVKTTWEVWCLIESFLKLIFLFSIHGNYQSMQISQLNSSSSWYMHISCNTEPLPLLIEILQTLFYTGLYRQYIEKGLKTHECHAPPLFYWSKYASIKIFHCQICPDNIFITRLCWCLSAGQTKSFVFRFVIPYTSCPWKGKVRP